MDNIRKAITSISLMLLFFTFCISGVLYAEECYSPDYLLDVESKYNSNDKTIEVSVTNPKPLIGEGQDIRIDNLEIVIYDGDKSVKKENVGSLNFDAGESKKFTVANLPEGFGANIVTIVVEGKLSGSLVGFGPISLNMSESVCGDDVLTFNKK
jgi:hypothetical protein